MQSFYDTISAELDRRRQSVLYVFGDFNARLGIDRPEIRLSCHQNTNRNGHMLGDFGLQHELVSLAHYFRKRLENCGRFVDWVTATRLASTMFWCVDAFEIWLRTAKLLIVGASLQIIEW